MFNFFMSFSLSISLPLWSTLNCLVSEWCYLMFVIVYTFIKPSIVEASLIYLKLIKNSDMKYLKMLGAHMFDNAWTQI